MPPNIQRFLPLILIVFLLLVVLPQITHHSSSKGPSSKDVSAETIAATGLVDKGEQAYLASHKGYTPHLADLLESEHALGPDLGDGVVVDLDVSSSGQTYVARVSSNVIALVRSRSGAKLIAKSCLVVKSSSGVACPAVPTPSKTTTSTATTTTTG